MCLVDQSKKEGESRRASFSNEEVCLVDRSKKEGESGRASFSGETPWPAKYDDLVDLSYKEQSLRGEAFQRDQVVESKF